MGEGIYHREGVKREAVAVALEPPAMAGAAWVWEAMRQVRTRATAARVQEVCMVVLEG